MPLGLVLLALSIALMVAGVLVMRRWPTVLGVVLNLRLASVERRDGPVPLWAAALGAGMANVSVETLPEVGGAWLRRQAERVLARPESLRRIGAIAALALVIAGGTGGVYYIPWTVYTFLADVDEVFTGRRREGIYAGAMTFSASVASNGSSPSYR